MTASANAPSARLDVATLGRFHLRRVIGRGGLGTVYEAWDPRDERAVALKTIDSDSPREAFDALKREFRAATRLHHPNLVRLFELGYDHASAFVVMELVRGEDFVRWCRPGGTLREDRLRFGLRQLTNALDALHHGGLVHRDVKPANVLVTGDERVVLLDFGLAARAGATEDDWGGDISLRGTPAYLAPERTIGLSSGPEGDWYSVGVMLFESLSGRLPFPSGSNRLGLFARKVHVGDESFPEAAPRDLVALCKDLLNARPAQRAGAAQCRRVLDPEARSEPRTHPPDAAFIGRARELEALDHALEKARAGATAVVVVRGASGIGKSSLVRELVRRVEPSFEVLHGRCHERESIPYKGIDAIVDQLVRVLWRSPAEGRAALVPPHPDLLLEVFPEFARVPELASADSPPRQTDAQQRRRLAYAQVKELVARLASRRPLLVLVDDWQWSDADSQRVLADLLEPPAPRRVAFVFVQRSGEGEPDWCGAWERTLATLGCEVEAIELGPLPREECIALARAVDADGTRAVPEAEALADASGGNPYLLETLARLRAPRLRRHPSVDDVVGELLGSCDGDARAVLRVLAAAGRPIASAVLRQASGAHADVLDALHGAKHLRWVGSDGFDLYHDALRASLLRTHPPEALAETHLALGLALEETVGTKDHAAIAQHFRLGGDRARAATHALRAADAAFASLAMGRAEAALRFALECGAPDVHAIELRRADALAAMGRCAEAAEVLRARAGAAREPHLVLARAAQHFMHSGRVDEGVETLRGALDALDLRHPEPDARTFASLAVAATAVVRGWRRSPPPDAPAALDVDRMTVCLAAGKGLAPSDPMRSAAYVLLASRFALEVGDRNGLAQCFAYLGLALSYAGVDRIERWGERLLADARAIAEAAGDVRGLAWVRAVRAVTLVGRRLWREGLDELDAASADLLEHTVGTHFEQASVRTTALLALLELGEFDELGGRARRLWHEAETMGDVFTSVEARIYVAVATLLEGRPTQATEILEDTLAGWGQRGYLFQHWLALRYGAFAALYRGEARAALEALRVGERRTRQEGLSGVFIIRVETLRLIGVAAVRCGDRAAATKAARALRREAGSWPLAWAELVEEGLRALARSSPPRREVVERACALLDETCGPWVSASVRASALRAAGDLEGARASESTLRAMGVAEPERWSALCAPFPF